MSDYKIIGKIAEAYIVKYPASEDTFVVRLDQLNEKNRKVWEPMCVAYDRKKKLEKLLS